MEPSFRSFSSMNLQSSREYSQPFHQVMSSEQIEYSSIISILQLFLNIESFFKKVCETSPSPAKLSGRIKKQLINFKSDNYTGISVIAQNMNSEHKPSFVLSKVLEDFKSCTEIPYEKRPDSLFLCSNNDFSVKLPFSKLISFPISELLGNVVTAKTIIAIDVVYDIPATCESVLSLLGNLTGYRNYDLAGMITGRGICYSSYLKNMDQWKSFTDHRLYSWLNIVWKICSSVEYPVLIVLSNCMLRTSPCYLSKDDLDQLTRVCRLQDDRIKVVYKEEPLDAMHEPKKTQQIEYTLDYVKRNQDMLNNDLKWLKDKEKSGVSTDRPSLYAEKDYRKIEKIDLNNEKIISRSRVVSIESEDNKATLNSSLKEELFHKPRGSSIESSQRGILKSNGDSRFGQNMDSYSPIFSPKDLIRYRIDEEITEKPSILRSSLDRKPEVEKKVNFSDNVFQIDDSVQGQMPEIKIKAVKMPNDKGKLGKYQMTESRSLIQYKATDLSELMVKNGGNDFWPCPKCGNKILTSLYECAECKYINWDRFYTIKSKINKNKSENIQVKNGGKIKEREQEVRNDIWKRLGEAGKTARSYQFNR